VKKRKSHYKILVTAGPTIEPIDPVRYISNYSSGIMGQEIALEAKRKGFKTFLVSGPVSIKPSKDVQTVFVKTARDMQREVMKRIKGIDCIIMSAAVCDFRPVKIKGQKIKKRQKIQLELVKNPDILQGLKKRNGLMKVGFALETEELVKNAKKKLKEKNLDLIVANKKDKSADPFGEGEKTFLIIDKKNIITELKNIGKKQCAKVIIEQVERSFKDE